MNDLDLYLRFKCEKELRARGLYTNKIYVDRFEYEYSVITKMNFTGYFLVVWDIINWSRKNNILTGLGRGSAAGSLVCWLLNITHLDPIKYNLYFERFLNPDRISFPDIDVDQPKDSRDLVVDYIVREYGQEKVCNIGTFNFLRAKAAARTACRVLNYPIPSGEKIANALMAPIAGKPQSIATSIEKVKEVGEWAERPDTEEGEILYWAQQIENRIASVGAHASGILISNENLERKVPLYKTRQDKVCSQYEMNDVERIGLIKFDILGLDALTKISKCLELIKKSTGEEVDFYNLPLDDEEVFKRLRAGDAPGVFQLEGSGGMRELLVKIKPTKVEDLILLVAVYRPGPLAAPEFQDYLNVRAGFSRPRYIIPELEPILGSTDGLLVYQEQLMRIAVDLCGYTAAEADVLRKATGKKIAKLMAEQEVKFKKGWVKNGHPSDAVDTLWETITGFAQYSFNLAHAAAYGLTTYATAYLKTHYPLEFMCSILECTKGNREDTISYIQECKRLGIKILPPDVNKSDIGFSISDGTIRFGLGAVKNIGDSGSDIIQNRIQFGQFNDVLDFLDRLQDTKVNKGKVEALIRSGCFDSFGKSRASLLANLNNFMEYKKKYKAYESKLSTYEKKLIKYNERLQQIEEGAKLKEFKEPVEPERPSLGEYIDAPEYSKQELLMDEYDLLGFFVSAHPLESVDPNMYKCSLTNIKSIRHFENFSVVNLPVVVAIVKELTTKTKKQMAFLTLEDFTGSIEAVLFPQKFDDYKHLLKEGIPVLIQGQVEHIDSDEDRISKLKINHMGLIDIQKMEKKKEDRYLTNLINKYNVNVVRLKPLTVKLKDGSEIVV